MTQIHTINMRLQHPEHHLLSGVTCDVCEYAMLSGSISGVTDICALVDEIRTVDMATSA